MIILLFIENILSLKTCLPQSNLAINFFRQNSGSAMFSLSFSIVNPDVTCKSILVVRLTQQNLIVLHILHSASFPSERIICYTGEC